VYTLAVHKRLTPERLVTMKRRVLVIPKEEIESHFTSNGRQDIKIVAPELLSGALYREMLARGKDVKPEEPLEGIEWRYSEASETNKLCESGDFVGSCLPQYVKGPFSVSFANQTAEQDEHYHRYHFEIYYSEQPMSAEFRYLEDPRRQPPIELKNGGAIIFGPGVIHKVRLGGLTLVIGIASISDKVKEKL
jgi:hypothetical protein